MAHAAEIQRALRRGTHALLRAARVDGDRVDFARDVAGPIATRHGARSSCAELPVAVVAPTENDSALRECAVVAASHCEPNDVGRQPSDLTGRGRGHRSSIGVEAVTDAPHGRVGISARTWSTFRRRA